MDAEEDKEEVNQTVYNGPHDVLGLGLAVQSIAWLVFFALIFMMCSDNVNNFMVSLIK